MSAPQFCRRGLWRASRHSESISSVATKRAIPFQAVPTWIIPLIKFAVNIFSIRVPQMCRLLPRPKLRNSRQTGVISRLRKMDFPFASAGIASWLQQPLPGRDLHSLEHFGFSRRKWAGTPVQFSSIINIGRLTIRWAAIVLQRTFWQSARGIETLKRSTILEWIFITPRCRNRLAARRLVPRTAAVC